MRSVLHFPRQLLRITINQYRKARSRKLLVCVVVLVVPLLIYAKLKLDSLIEDMHTHDQVHQYMGWWEQVCENATRGRHHLDEGATSCACVQPPHVHFDGLTFIDNLSDNKSGQVMETMHKTYYSSVEPGGHWVPSQCVARQRVAIVIPYRNREEHLKLFVKYMHPFLQHQNIDYQIFIIEQAGPKIFNRASLMNIGFLEALRQRDFDCFVFHDVDLLPLDPRNQYTCYHAPTHLGAYMNKFDYQMPYDKFFGGAVALSKDNMRQMNGFSNRFYGWGGEDDDTYNRVLWQNWTVHRHIQPIGKSHMIKHDEDEGNPKNPKRDLGYEVLPETYRKDGINSVVYITHQVDLLPLYTRILVSIEKEYLPECIVDSNKPASLDGNYVDCLTQERFDTQEVDCCRQDDGGLQCCNKGYGFDMYVAIETGSHMLLFVLTASAASCLTIVVILSWRRPQWLRSVYNRSPSSVQRVWDRMPFTHWQGTMPSVLELIQRVIDCLRTIAQRRS